MVK
ncbi:6a71855b-5bf1-42a4-9776-314e7df94940 [Thermothielavioides terrestris]|jgi:hypothetical protein